MESSASSVDDENAERDRRLWAQVMKMKKENETETLKFKNKEKSKKSRRGGKKNELLASVSTSNWAFDGEHEGETSSQKKEDEEPHWRCYLLGLCCPVRQKPESPEDAAISSWQRKNCKTFEEFMGLLRRSTEQVTSSIYALKELRLSLSFPDDENPRFHRLSSIGSYLWLLTYIIQHLSDPLKLSTDEDIYFDLNADVRLGTSAIGGIYENLAVLSQKFLQVADRFVVRTRDLREVGVEIVKRLQVRLSFARSPFLIRPEINIKNQRERSKSTMELKKIRQAAEKVKRYQEQAGKSGSKESLDRDRIIHDQLLELEWPVTAILFQENPTGGWEVFASLEIHDKLEIFNAFLEEPLKILREGRESFGTATRFVTEVEVPDQEGAQFSLMEITSGMLHFLAVNTKPGQEMERPGREHILMSLEKFWVNLDSLYNEAFEMGRLVRESRDVAQTCYVYTINFYKWELRPFETFDPDYEEKTDAKNKKMVEKFVAKLVGKTKFENVALFLSLADFNSSPYQLFVQNHVISSDGMTLKVDTWDDNVKETWSLLPDPAYNPGSDTEVNKRKKGKKRR